MRKYVLTVLTIVLVAIAVLVYWRHRMLSGGPRQESVDVLGRLHKAIANPSPDGLLPLLAMPPALGSRTPAEQMEFIGKALKDEISLDGIAVLSKRGAFGPLRDLFPDECDTWAAAAGVKPSDCVAFRMEHDGLRAEAVIATNGSKYRIVRVNNIRKIGR